MRPAEPLGQVEFAVLDAVQRGALRSRRTARQIHSLRDRPAGEVLLHDALRWLQETLGDGGGDARGVITVSQDDGDTLAGQVREDGTEAGEVADGSRRLRAHERGLDGSRPWADDPRVALALRLFYTAAVMVVVIWLLRNGNPVGGLLLVPAAAVWLRREAESGRLTAHARRAFRR